MKKNEIDCFIIRNWVSTDASRSALSQITVRGDPAEPVDEAEYLDEVEREAREIIRHKHINILPVSDTVDINLTIRIPQMAHSRKQRGN